MFCNLGLRGNLYQGMILGLWGVLVVLVDFTAAGKCFVGFVPAESTCCGVLSAE